MLFASAGLVLVALVAYLVSGAASRLHRIYGRSDIPAATDSTASLRIALLGAASVAPHALLYPSLSTQRVAVIAVGARSAARARDLAERWAIPKHGSYETVLADPEVDAVYVALINGAHYEWAAAALRAGKHVLLEKPLTNNIEQARALATLARQQNRLLLEGYHNLHHPLATRMREIVRSLEFGRLTRMHITSGLPAPKLALPIVRNALNHWLFGEEYAAEARSRARAAAVATPAVQSAERPAKMNVTLGGGRFLSQGCYTVSLARFLVRAAMEADMNADQTAADSATVESASMLEDEPASRVDVSTSARIVFGSANVTATLEHSSLAAGFNAYVTFEHGEMRAYNYLFPFIYHHLTLVDYRSGVQRVEKHYTQAGSAATDHEGESSFALQLEAFAAAVEQYERAPGQGGEAKLSAPLADVSAESAVHNMALIDGIYEEAGLGRRPGTAS